MNAPLAFTPLLKTRVWGGDTLKPRAPGGSSEPVGESWELADHGDDSTIVAAGPHQGRSLHDLMEDKDLCGKAVDPANPGVFPLLLKLLDPRQDLSVQVHPDDRYAGTQQKGELGKTEAWYVLEADPGGRIYRGVKDGVTREAFKAALKDGTVAELLHPVTVRPGDVYFIPSGTIHALCSGVRIAEIQQNSDTTYRVFDWNRLGLDGKPRDLHIDHALAVSNFNVSGPDRCEPTPLPHKGCLREQFISCEKFCFERLSNFRGMPVELTTGGDCFHILTVVDGEIEVTSGGGSLTRKKWDTVLIPAGAGQYSLQSGPEATLLLFYRPVE